MTTYSDQSPVNFSDPMPEKVDVVVIGAGVIGISIAWFLAKRGVSVAVCEKGRVAGEQSSRNWGWIRQHGRDYAELPIMMESIDLWESMSREIDEDIGFTRRGVLYLAKDQAEMARDEMWLDVARPHNLATRMLGANEIGELIKGNPGNWIGGAYTDSDGRAEPGLAVPALARAVQKMGVSIIEGCAVRTLDTSAGAISGVVTERGLIKCDTAVCAGGAWASLFSRNHGCEFPQLNVRSTVARTASAPEIFSGNAASTSLAFRYRQDGGYTLAAVGFIEHFISRDSFRYANKFLSCFLASKKDLIPRFEGLLPRLKKIPGWGGDDISPFEQTRVLNPQPLPGAVDEIKKQLTLQLPALANTKIEESWAGMIDVTPDIVPVMDAVEGLPGYYIAAGFCGHGFGIGPGAGRLMADMIMGNPVGHDVSRFRFGRFNDGGKLELGPAL
jgi:glycine/D-amino acid oxidase-like deaminating enzyme